MIIDDDDNKSEACNLIIHQSMTSNFYNFRFALSNHTTYTGVKFNVKSHQTVR